ncbi:DNA translocase FtsK [Terribacillus saccharophilus]|uniref:DNA translocase FtsK n=1 Tax=Terribacillus saccharophilus TaxID=361277 RepID=UPI0039819CEB
MWERLKQALSNFFMTEVVVDEEPELKSRNASEQNGQKQYQSNQQPQAKMAYTYPKERAFRFPMIPDESENGKPAVTNLRPVRRSEQPQTQRQRRDSQQQARPDQKAEKHKASEGAPASYRQRQTHQRPRPEPKDDKKPFQPTEVPSPVYGFRKRKEDAEDVVTLASIKERSDWKRIAAQASEISVNLHQDKQVEKPISAETGEAQIRETVEREETVTVAPESIISAEESAAATPAPRLGKELDQTNEAFGVMKEVAPELPVEQENPIGQEQLNKSQASEMEITAPDSEQQETASEPIAEQGKPELDIVDMPGSLEEQVHGISAEAPILDPEPETSLDASQESEPEAEQSISEDRDIADTPTSFEEQVREVSAEAPILDREPETSLDASQETEPEAEQSISNGQDMEDTRSVVVRDVPAEAPKLNHEPEALHVVNQDNAAEYQAAVKQTDEKHNDTEHSAEQQETTKGTAYKGNENIRESGNAIRKPVPFNVFMTPRDKRKSLEKTKPTVDRITEESAEQVKEEQTEPHFISPPMHLLNDPVEQTIENDAWVDQQINLLETTLEHFNVNAHVVNAMQGPSVTRFEVQPEMGVKVSKIKSLTDDIKLNMAAKDIRMEAPIPGKNAIGIEVPNAVSKMVGLQEILDTGDFQDNESPLSVALGLNISGNPIVTDLQKMPHGLIAGATGSGKSVCINTILLSLLYKANHKQVKFLLIDPKMVELAPYNDLPHLVSPVITDTKAATAALKWAVNEMEERYVKFVGEGVRDIGRYNEKLTKQGRYADKLPYLVIVIDELADLMMVAPQDVEDAICRIAQKARAAGIHLLLATQRPSVDVITGLIKANIPTRIAFSVSSAVDSRTIIDNNGAEKLLGKGDMLFVENGARQAQRIQGAFVSDEEIERVVQHVKQTAPPEYLFQHEDLLERRETEEEEDELYREAVEFVIEHNSASASLLQRRFKIGYNRAARLIDHMEMSGVISEQKGSKPRDVLVSLAQLQAE